MHSIKGTSAAMIKKRDILIVGLQSMDMNIGSNAVNLAMEFARHNRVLFVNYAPDRLTLIRKKNQEAIRNIIRVIKGIDPALRQKGENLWVLTPKIILEPVSRLRPKLLFNLMNKRNALKLASQIKEALSELGIKDFILFNDSDFYRSFYLKELLKPSVFIYYSRDNMTATDFFRRYGQEYEGNLMRKADAVVTNSEYLRKKAEIYNASSYYVGQGCDQELFNLKNVKEMPAELKDIPSPRIGYVGALTAKRLDIGLLQKLAESRPDWNLVLTGPEDEIFQNSTLHRIKNVHFTGPVSQEMLPTYIYHFDVAINPQKRNALTMGNYPRKIDEYLMMGKSVVATRTEAMDIFKGYVFMAESHDEFIDKIAASLIQNTPEMANNRMMFAREHTWGKSAEEIYRIISKMEEKQK